MIDRADYFIPSSELFTDPRLGLSGRRFAEQFNWLSDTAREAWFERLDQFFEGAGAEPLQAPQSR